MKKDSHNKIINILRKIFQVILTVFIVIMAILVFMVIYNFVEIKIKKKDYANYFGYTYMNVISGSMADAINVDDYIFIKLNDKDFKEGDVITFKVDDAIITHRVMTIYDGEILTKGDANNDSDNVITYDDVIGKVVYVGKDFGVYMKVLATPSVFISAFGALILFDLSLSPEERSEKNSEKKKKTE